MNIVTDLAILIVPIPVLSKLQLPRKKKVGLILIFAAGSLYVGCLCLSPYLHWSNKIQCLYHEHCPSQNSGCCNKSQLSAKLDSPALYFAKSNRHLQNPWLISQHGHSLR